MATTTTGTSLRPRWRGKRSLSSASVDGVSIESPEAVQPLRIDDRQDSVSCTQEPVKRYWAVSPGETALTTGGPLQGDRTPGAVVEGCFPERPMAGLESRFRAPHQEGRPPARRSERRTASPIPQRGRAHRAGVLVR